MNNKLIEELYNKIDAQNKMINDLQLKLTKEKEKNSKAIEYIKENASYDINIKQCRDNLFDCECDDLLKILGDKDE